MVSRNPNGRPPKEKCFANMLRIAINEAVEGGSTKLRAVADSLVEKAMTGDVPAIKEVADRLDGRVPQSLVGGDDDDNPLKLIARIERVIVESEQAIAAAAVFPGEVKPEDMEWAISAVASADKTENDL